MASNGDDPQKTPTPQSIPLQDLSRPQDGSDGSWSSGSTRRTQGRSSRSFAQRAALLNRNAPGSRYERLAEGSPSRQEGAAASGRLQPGMLHTSHTASDDDLVSPLEDIRAFADATAAVGLSFDSHTSREPPVTPPQPVRNQPIIIATSDDQGKMGRHTDGEILFSPNDDDTTPLRETHLRPSIQVAASTPKGQRHDRQTQGSGVHWLDVHSPEREMRRSGSRLGDDLPIVDAASGLHHKTSTASGRSRLGSVSSAHESGWPRSTSPNASPLARANSMLRMMSQRVVNLSNDTEMVEQSIRRKSSMRSARMDAPPSLPAMMNFAHDSVSSPVEDELPPRERIEEAKEIQETLMSPIPSRFRNPLRGKSCCLFGPENWFRKGLCEMLVHPVTEPLILVLIIAQTVLLAVDSAPNVENDPRSSKWGTSKVDYALLALFILYTFELIARTIVSGFIWNAEEYSTLDRSLGLKNAFHEHVRKFFTLERHDSVRKPNLEAPEQPSIIHSFTGMSGHALDGIPEPDKPGHGLQQQRVRLARRAFLRHSYNRLDLIAVTSFWISFGLSVTSFEATRHVYVFRMMSCLRIVRLLGLTSGTSIILRSLKKAAPLLVNVAFLISFFWLLFAIVGVQSFKSSLRRTCVWVGPPDVGNYTQNLAPKNVQFCGGHLDLATGLPMPWLTADGSNGTTSHKGYLCPQGSLCVEGTNPYNNTVSFDNVLQSIELVFVVISSNTFTDLLYYLTESDYLAAALFFAAGIVIMSLWLTNLLVAVITSSFLVIREESKRSAFTAENLEEAVAPEDETPPPKGLQRLYNRTYWFWITVISAGLIIQCLRSADMSNDRLRSIMDAETVVTFVLLVEIVLRFVSDWRGFHRSRRNWVDLSLAVITTIIQISSIRNSGQAYAWLTFFQIARIYRVVMAFGLTRGLIMVVFTNVTGLLNLILFVFLITFLAAILASQLFRGEFPATDEAGSTIHITFFDIYNSWIGMYQILSSENWTILMYNATQFDVQWETAWLGAIFFIMWFIFANFIILNMFIAVVQESFDVSEDEKRLQQVKAFLLQKEVASASHGSLSLSSIFKMGRSSFRQRDPLDYGQATIEQLLKDAVVKEFLDEPEEPLSRRSTMPLPTNFGAGVETDWLSAMWSKIPGLRPSREPNPFYSKPVFSKAYEDLDPRSMAKEVVTATEHRRRAQRQYLIRHPKYNKALFIFNVDNPIRKFCQRIVGAGRGDERAEGVEPWKPVWYTFSAFIYAAIVCMVLLACITTPLFQREYYQKHSLSIRNWFVWTDLGFAIIFSIEAIIKVIADGFFFTPNAYFHGTWGFIDGIVLITLWINVITSLYRDDGVSRAVGAFKALRALRLLNVSESARDTFHNVIVTGGVKIISAAFVSLSLLVPFAILGTNLFNGQMETCNDTGFEYTSLSNCVGEYNSTPFRWTVLAPHVVANPYYSFDNFGSSLFILFQTVSQEGWTDVMWSAMSTAGKGVQPQNFAAQGNAIYFIIFNLLGSVFVLALFISVFMRNHTEQTGMAFLTAEQRSWLELRKLLRQISPPKRSLHNESQKWRKWCHKLAVQKHGKWQRFITFVLVLHLTLLVMEFYPEPEWWTRLRDYLFLFLTSIFLINVVIRIIGLSWKRFRRSSWDMYSIFSVTGVLVTTVMTLSIFNNSTYDRLHKLFLVSIAFLIIPRNNQLDQLFKTAAASLSSIANLLATWSVLFLAYAIAFTQTLGLTRFGTNENGNLNFRDVPKALILLFRMSCGEGWNAIMEDFATIIPPYCVQQDSFFQSDCGSAAWARALFVSWNIISMYIFVSLFVSLIFESFSYVYQRRSGLTVISRDEIRRFKEAWSEFDPRGTGYISKEAFPRLLGELSGVFQMRIYEGDHSVRNILESCQVDPRASFQAPANPRIMYGINLDKLNKALNTIPLEDIRKKRVRMNVFYQEILVSADPDRGISFTSCLMILAHYNVIDDTKSLRLDEFLKRRARLQRVQESIRRDIVIGFFDMMYRSRRFRREQNLRKYSNLAGPVQLAVPEIFVEDPDDSFQSSESIQPRDFTEGVRSPSPLGPDYGTTSSRSAPRIDTTLRRRDSAKTPSPTASEISPSHSPSPTRGLSPNRLFAADTSYGGVERPRTNSSRPGHSRQGSAVSAQGVLDSFDNSAWGDSLRRSFSTRRPSHS